MKRSKHERRMRQSVVTKQSSSSKSGNASIDMQRTPSAYMSNSCYTTSTHSQPIMITLPPQSVHHDLSIAARNYNISYDEMHRHALLDRMVDNYGLREGIPRDLSTGRPDINTWAQEQQQHHLQRHHQGEVPNYISRMRHSDGRPYHMNEFVQPEKLNYLIHYHMKPESRYESTQLPSPYLPSRPQNISIRNDTGEYDHYVLSARYEVRVYERYHPGVSRERHDHDHRPSNGFERSYAPSHDDYPYTHHSQSGSVYHGYDSHDHGGHHSRYSGYVDEEDDEDVSYRSVKALPSRSLRLLGN